MAGCFPHHQPLCHFFKFLFLLKKKQDISIHSSSNVEINETIELHVEFTDVNKRQHFGSDGANMTYKPKYPGINTHTYISIHTEMPFTDVFICI